MAYQKDFIKIKNTSINIHLGIEPSRRDDIESIGYMLIYFLKGELPWQGLKKQKGVDHLDLISEVKLSTSIKNLCENIPEEIFEYLQYIRKISFEERPNYIYLKELFINCAKKNNVRLEYDF